ncbi:MAG: DUF3307 domain-containing protein [Sulfitobacter sp.]
MDTALTTALVLLTLLQVKHLFADFFLQTPRMLAGRNEYIHVGRMQHAGLHAVFSLAVVSVVGAPLGFSIILCLIEFVVHYHIDWAKGRHSQMTQYTPNDPGYWRAFGVDQLMHQLTYVAMLWAWATFAV